MAVPAAWAESHAASCLVHPCVVNKHGILGSKCSAVYSHLAVTGCCPVAGKIPQLLLTMGCCWPSMVCLHGWAVPHGLLGLLPATIANPTTLPYFMTYSRMHCTTNAQTMDQPKRSQCCHIYIPNWP